MRFGIVVLAALFTWTCGVLRLDAGGAFVPGCRRCCPQPACCVSCGASCAPQVCGHPCISRPWCPWSYCHAPLVLPVMPAVSYAAAYTPATYAVAPTVAAFPAVSAATIAPAISAAPLAFPTVAAAPSAVVGSARVFAPQGGTLVPSSALSAAGELELGRLRNLLEAAAARADESSASARRAAAEASASSAAMDSMQARLDRLEAEVRCIKDGLNRVAQCLGE